MSKMGTVYLAVLNMWEEGYFYTDIIDEVAFDYNCSKVFVAKILNNIIKENAECRI